MRPHIKRLILIPLLLALALPAAPAQARTPCNTHACEVRVAKKQCSQANPRKCVRHAILVYRLKGANAAWMYRIAGCESTWNPYAKNASGSSGLFQFLPSTFAGTPYARHSIWSAKYNSLAAAWMVTQGRQSEWVCK